LQENICENGDGWNCISIKADGLTAVITNRLQVRKVADPSGRAV
jgi:hypothetical protein